MANNISYIQLAATGVKYPIEDALAIHFAYFTQQLQELSTVIAGLNSRINQLEYDMYGHSNGNSSDSVNLNSGN